MQKRCRLFYLSLQTIHFNYKLYTFVKASDKMNLQISNLAKSESGNFIIGIQKIKKKILEISKETQVSKFSLQL